MTTTQTQSVEQVKREILSDLRTRCWENAEQVDAYFETALDRMAEAVRDEVLQEERRFILNVLDGIDSIDGTQATSAIRKMLGARYSGR